MQSSALLLIKIKIEFDENINKKDTSCHIQKIFKIKQNETVKSFLSEKLLPKIK